MSHIDELIAELVPDGVTYRALSDVATFRRGTSLTKKVTTEGSIPVLAGGRMPAYRHGVSNRSGDTIAVAGSGAYAGFVTFWAEPVFVSDAFTVHPNPLLLAPKYVYHFLLAKQEAIHAKKSVGGVPHVKGGDLARFRIPVPPLEVQQEIVKVLDLFKELEEELEEELGARCLQYAFYRDSILSFSENSQVPRVPMGDLGMFIRGRRFTKNDFVEVGIPSIHYGEIYTHYRVTARSTLSHVRSELAGQLRFAETGDVVIATVGETVEDVGKAVAWVGDERVAIHDDTFLFRGDLDPTYVSYCMQTADFHSQKNKYVARAKVKRLSGESLAKIQIPVPSLDEQARIVSILDKFEALVNDPSIGLPAELAARRKQYEYYRDRLMTFEETVV